MPGGIKRKNWEARIFKRLRKTKNNCWLWPGATNQGYGYAHWQGRFILIHRFVFKKFRGWIPSTKILNHKCRKRNCANPAHLEITTHRKNILAGIGRGAINARKKKCKYGHWLRGKNIYQDPGTRFRRCRKCIARRTKKWRMKK